MNRPDNFDRMHFEIPRSPNKFSRREFVVVSLAAGFALSVMPVSAQTITTDSDGLVAGEVKIPVQGGTIPAYRAMPAAAVLSQRYSWCMKSSASTSTSRISAVASARPDTSPWRPRSMRARATSRARPTSRRSFPSCARCLRRKSHRISTRPPHGQEHRQGGYLAAGHHWILLGRAAGVALCSAQSELKAGVAWYGPLQFPKSDNAPINPGDEVKQMNAPVLGLYGGADEGIPASQIDAMRAAIKAAGKSSEIVVYPNTPHAFNADYRPSYRPKEAKDGWARMIAWFKKNGVA